MSEEWFADFTKRVKLHIELLKDTAEYFIELLTNVSIKYTEISSTPIVIILSKSWHVPGSRIIPDF